MPNLVTHYLCGLDAVKNLEVSDCRQLINKYHNVFNLGLQGPDILFYYEVWPWSSKSLDKNIGEIMHISKVNKMFGAFIDYIIQKNGDEKNILTVYLMGFICHNIMDSIAHPYIFYRSGFNTPKFNNENLFLYYHRRFETSVDVLLCQDFLNKKIYELNIDNLIKVNDTELNLISELYRNAVKLVFNYDISKKKFIRAVKEMQLIEKLLKDPKGWKKKLIGFIDNIIYGFPLFSSLIFPLELKDGLDYLNLSNREWSMPHDETIKSSKSFLDLFYEASEKTGRLCDKLYCTLYQNNPCVSYVLELLGNNSYISGIDCDRQAVFKYSDIIFS